MVSLLRLLPQVFKVRPHPSACSMWPKHANYTMQFEIVIMVPETPPSYRNRRWYRVWEIGNPNMYIQNDSTPTHLTHVAANYLDMIAGSMVVPPGQREDQAWPVLTLRSPQECHL